MFSTSPSDAESSVAPRSALLLRIHVKLLVTVLALAFAVWGAAPAAASALEPTRAEIIADLSAKMGVSMEVVERDLAVMTRVTGDLAGDLQKAIRSDDWGGFWFDYKNAVYKVGLVEGAKGAARSTASAIFADQGVATDVDFVPVERSVADLNAVRERLIADLSDPIKAIEVRVDGMPADEPTTIRVVVDPAARKRWDALLDRAIASAGSGSVSIRESTHIKSARPDTCTFPDCDRPLHGGVRIWPYTTTPDFGCSHGALVNVDGSVFSATAGHCVAGSSAAWLALHNTTGQWNYLGTPWASTFGAAGDWALLYVPYNTFWTGVTWLPYTVIWGLNHDMPVNAVVAPTLGEPVCKVGRTTSVTCGNVTNLTPQPVPYAGATVGNLVQTNYCSAPGDSGGTVTRGYGATMNTILGLHSGSSGCGSQTAWFMPFSRMMAQIAPGHWAAYVVTQ